MASRGSPSRFSAKSKRPPPREKPPATRPASATLSSAASAKLPSARDALIALSLFIATLLAYWPALRGNLLWDDDGHITKPWLQSLQGLRRIWFDLGATQQYYPFLHSAFWFEHRLWGDAVLGYHLSNVALHTLAALLVVAIVRRLALPGAWLAGFIFALHPVAVEAVAWISEQKSTLSAVFYLAALLVYLKYDSTRQRTDYFVALALFVFALATKTVTATLPAALLVIFWWQRGRIDWRRDCLPLAPWLAIGASAGIFTAWVERTYIGAQGSDYSLSFLDRTLLAGRVICFYLWKLVWPANLMFFYPHWKIDSAVWWQYLFPAGVLALAGTFFWLAHRKGHNRAPLAALLFFTGTLFPVVGFLNVYPFVYSYVADHFAYLASLGVIVPLAAVLSLMTRRLSFDPRIATAALAAILAVLTWRESRSYKDVETLYLTTLARNPESWISQNNLGDYLLDKGQIPQAMEHFNAALKLKPNSAEAMNNLGSAYSRTGRQSQAQQEFEAALRIRPKFAEAEDNLGAVLAKTPGRASEAIPHFEAALRINPDYARAHNNLGVALASIPGRQQEAVAEYETALALDPKLTEAHNNLANVLAETGRVDDAVAEYKAALGADADSAEAHSNLGNILSKSGKQPEAISEFQTALKINPNSAEAHNGLGLALASSGKPQEALAEYQTALRLNPNLAEAHNDLGTLLAQSGHMKEAADEFAAAVRAQPDSVESHMNLANALGEIPGRKADAAAEYKFVVRARPDFAEAHYFLGLTLAGLPGRTDEAIRELETAVKLKPDPEVQELISRMKSARGAR